MAENRRIADVILHPVRLKIVHQLGGRSMTTAELRTALPDVKQATLYRHISALLEAEVLTVVEERQVRGTIERTLALGERMAHVDQRELQEMDQAQLRAGFMNFLSSLSSDFDDLLEHDDDQLRGFLGFGRGPLYLDRDDLEKLQSDFNDLLAPYLQQRSESQRRITLATALIPETR